MKSQESLKSQGILESKSADLKSPGLLNTTAVITRILLMLQITKIIEII